MLVNLIVLLADPLRRPEEVVVLFFRDVDPAVDDLTVDLLHVDTLSLQHHHHAQHLLEALRVSVHLFGALGKFSSLMGVLRVLESAVEFLGGSLGLLGILIEGEPLGGKEDVVLARGLSPIELFGPDADRNSYFLVFGFEVADLLVDFFDLELVFVNFLLVQ